MMDEGRKNKLIEESHCFDQQIIERVEHGHVPDLQQTERCEWFYNNIWRDPFYADMFYGQTVRDIKSVLQKNLAEPASELNILEVACGPGHIALELSRSGYNVVGLDISSYCIELAKKIVDENTGQQARGRLEYVVSDFYEYQPDKRFDMVVFSCALHHFEDVDVTLDKVNDLLNPEGLIFVSEPTKECMSDVEAGFVYFIRSLLSLGGNYYQDISIPDNDMELQDRIRQVKNEFGYVDDSGNNIQSPMDNELSYHDMCPALKKHFVELEVSDDFAFFDRVVGGLRLNSVEEERKLAKWICQIDKLLVSSDLFKAQQFHFAGRKRQ